MKLPDALAALNHEVEHGGAIRKGDRYYPSSKRSEHIIGRLELLGATQHLPLKDEPVKAQPVAQRPVAPAPSKTQQPQRPPQPRPHGDPKTIMQDFAANQRNNQPHGRPGNPNGQQKKKHGLHKPKHHQGGARPGQRPNQPAGHNQNRGPRPQQQRPAQTGTKPAATAAA